MLSDRGGGGGGGGGGGAGGGGGVQSGTGYLRLTLVFVWDGPLREGFNFCFSRVFG